MFGCNPIFVFLFINAIMACNVNNLSVYERQQQFDQEMARQRQLDQELAPKRLMQRFLETFKTKCMPMPQVTGLILKLYEKEAVSRVNVVEIMKMVYGDRHYFRDAYPLDLDQAQRYTEDFKSDFFDFMNLTHLLV